MPDLSRSADPARTSCSRSSLRGFSVVEVIVVIGIIAILLAILLPALSAVRRQSLMASSQNNMRHIATWMNLYSKDHRETMLPSQFDYSEHPHPGKVRSQVTIGEEHQGTWADILWTIHGLGRTFADVDFASTTNDYMTDAPDRTTYIDIGDSFPNPLRSAVQNTKNFPDSDSTWLARPHGDGAHEQGLPGFFAANDFFNARPDAPDDAGGNAPPSIGRWYSTGQIRIPERSLYLIDSFAGEVIEPVDVPWENEVDRTIEVDFRYNGVSLMLFLDGHTEPQAPWLTLDDLEKRSQVRVRRLDRRPSATP